MIRVAFIGAVSKEWMGGLNYYKNLLYAVSTYKQNEIKVFVFVGKKTDIEIKTMFKKYAIVIEDSTFDKKSIKWFLYKLENKIFKTNKIFGSILKKYEIQVLSHTGIVGLKSVKTVNWIPDFQHLYLPNMFSEKEVINRNNSFLNLIINSDKIVLSSYDALNDFRKFAPEYEKKVEVLQFVSQPDEKYFSLTQKDENRIREKYDIRTEFFYMPNQFWKHKNHMLVFRAVKELVNEGNNICVVCTGSLEDYRNKEYIKEIRYFIKKNNLEKNILLLGLIDYKDVFGLIKFSRAVINPSLFEGWSSTVEECKSVGKNMILSDLGVHKEQYPDTTFFQKNNEESLKNILLHYNSQKDNQVKQDLETRTEEFSDKYFNVLNKLVLEAKTDNKFESLLFLSKNEGRQGEGGLRKQGYFKKSYDDKPLISVVTVVYNGTEFIEETIQSIINQTYENAEYIIIDGGSTDGTVDIIKKYEDRIDYWVSEPDQGIYDAMNKGISLCNGEIIGLVNADDYIHNNTLQVIVEMITSAQVDFVYADLDIIDENGKKIDTISSIGLDNIRFKAFKQMPFLHPSLFVKKEVYEVLGLYSTDYKLSSDYDFSLRLANSNFIGKKIQYTTGVFRLGGQSGGIETYIENHKIALNHKHNIVLVYMNTAILVVKMHFRTFLSRWR